ncbi:MAG: hypothetical protein JXB48_17090 [Candidatus Latescibacteria bacterium]|nr:hypothetical protein [Candidatus Latescibacterota bacterium]
MSTAVFVVDTSYLLELFNVPSHSSNNAVVEIRKRFEKAINNQSRLFVPLPCIYELARHIAQVENGDVRKEIAGHVYEIVKSSVKERIPWNITPSLAIEELPKLFEDFANKYVLQKISLTDTSVIREAKRLKKKYSDSRYTVHIWTTDSSLKAHEPDNEFNAFTG